VQQRIAEAEAAEMAKAAKVKDLVVISVYAIY
jgi:hypothetical protein